MGDSIEPYQFEPLLTTEEIESLRRRVRHDEEREPEALGEGRVGHSRWCTCHRCPQMTTEVESVCCKELREAVDKMGDVECITALGHFENVCLDREVLRTALVAMTDV